MPSRTPIPAEINNHNFEALYRKEPHARTRIRYLCMSHIEAGKSFSEIAQMLKVSRETIRIWVKRFAEEGLTGLCERPGRGAKQRLSPRDEPVFKKAVEALQAERAGGRVTGHDIRDLLISRFSAVYTLDGVYKLLKRLELVFMSARSIAPQADLEAQKALKKLSARGEGRFTGSRRYP